MSPEQAKGAEVDARSDLYSLGAVGFYAVSGRLPFEGPSASAVLAMHVTQPAPPVASRAPQLSTALARVIDRCLRKEPDHRFADGGDIVDALGEDAANERPLPVALREFIKHLRKQRKSVGALGFFLAVLIVFPLVPEAAEGFIEVAIAAGVTATVIAGALGGCVTHEARKVLKAGHAADDVLQSVTMELDAAKGLAHDMDGLLEGHREVERLLAERRATGTLTIVTD